MSQQSPGYSQSEGQPTGFQQPYSPAPGYVDPYSNAPGQQYPGYPQGPNQQPPKKPKKSVWKRWWMICIYIIVGLAIIGNLGDGGSEAASSGPSASADPSDRAAAKPVKKETKAAGKKAGIGTAVKSDDLTLTVTEFKCGVSVSDPIEDLTPQGQFCKMSVTIKNDGSDQATVDDSQMKVKDAKGNEYGTSGDTWAVDGSIFLKQINPGNKISGVAYYDVPVGTKPVTAVFKGSIFSSAAEVSLS